MVARPGDVSAFAHTERVRLFERPQFNHYDRVSDVSDPVTGLKAIIATLDFCGQVAEKARLLANGA